MRNSHQQRHWGVSSRRRTSDGLTRKCLVGTITIFSVWCVWMGVGYLYRSSNLNSTYYEQSSTDYDEYREEFGVRCPSRCPRVEVDENNPGRDTWYREQLEKFGDTPKANGWDFTHEQVAQLMKPLHLRQGSTVVELGSGTGKFLQMVAETVYAEQSAIIKGLGVELLSFYVDHARLHYPQFLFCCGSAANISFIPTDSADAVFSNFVLNAVPNDVATEVVEEALRVLKTGGHALFGCVNTVERAPDYQYGLDKKWWIGVAKRHDMPTPKFQPAVFASQGYRYDVFLTNTFVSAADRTD